MNCNVTGAAWKPQKRLPNYLKRMVAVSARACAGNGNCSTLKKAQDNLFRYWRPSIWGKKERLAGE